MLVAAGALGHHGDEGGIVGGADALSDFFAK
jgi:hypothetical protein